jgi:ribosomal protein L7/L12
MAYTFSTFVSVPDSVIRQLSGDVVSRLMKILESEGEFNDVQRASIEHSLYNAFLTLISDQSDKEAASSVDGFHLTNLQILEVAGYLKEGAFVDAVRAFRSYSGCGLREAKEFIERFDRGSSYAATAFIEVWK